MKLWWAYLFLIVALPQSINAGYEGWTSAQFAQHSQEQDSRIAQLDQKVTALEGKLPADAGGASFLCAVFCALWAQNTRRSAWLWFFFGLICTVLALIVLLYKNSNDIFLRDDEDRRNRLFPGSRHRQQ